ncbi:MAG: hypothetical protein ACJ748_13440 [Flavisolibacter sp.]
MKNIFSECIEIVKELVGNEFLYLDSGVEVKITPHSVPFLIWAMSVSPKDELFVMDNNEEWHKVELEDVNADLIIGSLFQRLRLMRVNYAKAS